MDPSDSDSLLVSTFLCASSAIAHKPRVLVVDDEPEIQHVAEIVLREQGYDVETATNGQAAIDLIADGWRPDLILMDLRMPVMDGTTAIDRLRHNPATAAIPVIAMSGSQVLRAGFGDATAPNSFLSKPFAIDALVGIVARRLTRGE
jgi:CheY-like chemotaxis protein